jgi:DNA-binding SARP family transcriptional activator
MSPGAARGLIGRHHELSELHRAVDRALGGAGSVWLIHGEAGVGKTRLASEALAYAAEHGALAVTAASWDQGGAPPFWPWAHALRTIEQRLTASGRAIAHGVDLGDSVPEDERDRFALFEATLVNLRRAAAATPIVILLDDLHAADLGTVLLLRFIAAGVTDSAVMVIGTYRPDDVRSRVDLGELAFDHLDRAVRDGGSISLGGLSLEHVDQLLKGSVAADPEPWVVARIHQLTGGNPLFVKHLAPTIATGLADDDFDRFDVPDGIRRLLGERLVGLGPDERDLLRIAAVVGLDVSLDVLTAVAAVDTDSVVTRLTPACQRGFVTIEGDRVGFSHPLLREVLIDEVEPQRRQLLHASVADMLTTEAHGSLEEIAHHLLQAGPGFAVAAAHACRAAAIHAAEALAFEDAIVNYRRGLRALADIDAATGGEIDLLRLDLHVGLGRTCWRAARRPECDAAFDDAWEIALRIGDADRLADVALGGGFSKAFTQSFPNERVDRCRFALDRIGDAPTTARSLLLAKLACELVGHPDQSLARTAAVEALAIARETGDERCIGEALAATLVTELGPDLSGEHRALADEMMAIARRRGDRALAVQARFQLVGTLVEHGDRPGLDVVVNEQHREVDELAEPGYRRHDVWFRAMLASVDGDIANAERLVDEGLVASNVADDPDGALVWGGQLGVIRWMQGRINELEPLYRDMATTSSEPVWTTILAWLWSRNGLRTAAQGLLDRVSGRGFTDVPTDRHWLLAMSTAAEAAARVGDRAAADALAELLEPFADRMVPIAMGISYWGTVARPLAMIELMRGHDDRGIELLEAAVVSTARFGALPWLVEAQLDLAVALSSRRHDATGPQRAQALIDEARTTSDRLGLAELADRAAALGGRLGHLAPAPGLVGTAPAPATRATSDRPAPRPRIEVLGGFRCIDIDGSEIRWSSRRARTALKLLVDAHGGRVPRETLMDQLWPGEAPDDLSNRLSVAISTIRRSFDPHHQLPRDAIVGADRYTVWLEPSAVDVDLDRFMTLAGRAAPRGAGGGEPADDLAVLAVLQEACGAYGGTAFADEPYDDRWAGSREMATSAYIELCLTIAEIARRHGHDTMAAAALRDAVEADPYDERAHLAVIELHRSCGAHGLADLATTRYRDVIARTAS